MQTNHENHQYKQVFGQQHVTNEENGQYKSIFELKNMQERYRKLSL